MCMCNVHLHAKDDFTKGKNGRYKVFLERMVDIS
jgi:hypothetical protein